MLKERRQDIVDDILTSDMQSVFKKFSEVSEGAFRALYKASTLECRSIISSVFNVKDLFSSVREELTYNGNYEYAIYIIKLIVDYWEEYLKRLGNTQTQEESVYVTKINEFISDNIELVNFDITAFLVLINSIVLENIEELNNNINSQSKDMNSIYANSGAHLFSKDFIEIEKEENTAKIMWLFISVFMILFMIFLLNDISNKIIAIVDKNDINYINQSLILIVVRFPLVIVSFFSFIWIARRYTIAREKEIFYRHIASALLTFKSFYSTADHEHKGLVLMEAAKTIFTPPIEKNSEPQVDSAKMLDIVKLLSQTAAKHSEPIK